MGSGPPAHKTLNRCGAAQWLTWRPTVWQDMGSIPARHSTLVLAGVSLLPRARDLPSSQETPSDEDLNGE
jgi:hypothetical protein